MSSSIPSEPKIYATLSNPSFGFSGKEELTDILENPDQDLISHAVTFKPKAGEVYVYKLSSLPSADDVKCDGYIWRQTKLYHFPETDPVGEIRYYAVLVDGRKCFDFRRQIITLKNGSEYALVQYLGDHSVYRAHIHGNTKDQGSKREFVRESKTVKHRIIEEAGDRIPIKVYHDIVSKSSDKLPVYVPRNPKKVTNVMQEARQKLRYSRDELYNLCVMATDMPQFLKTLTIAPQMVIHLIYTPLLDAFHDSLESSTIENPMYLTYDTTFKIGDCYVSVLSFRNCLFQGKPIMPIAILIHDRKYRRDHELFIEEFFLNVTRRPKLPVALVTDREFDFKRLPDFVVPVYCWLHIRKDAKNFVRYTVHGTSKDIEYYDNVVHDLLKSRSKEEYALRKDVESRVWSPEFTAYFEKNLESAIRDRSNRGHLDKLGIYCPTSGITTNSAESINSVLKRFFLWRERPLDIIVLAIFQLCRFYEVETIRGYYGTGRYILRPEFPSAGIEHLPKLPATIPPDEIVDRLRNDHIIEMKTNVFNDPGLLKTDSILGISADEEDTDATCNEEKKDPNSGKSVARPNSACSMAQCVVAEGRIRFIPSLKAFLVEGTDKNKYAVTIFPEQKCQCPAIKTCYHIQAALIYLGAENKAPKRPKLNLSVLKRYGRKKEGKSGRKLPRKFDYEISAAPDSLEAEDGVKVRCIDSTSTSKPLDQQQQADETVAKQLITVDVQNPQIVTDQPPTLTIPAPNTADQLPTLFTWGSKSGTMFNTCPIDNMLSLFYLASQQSAELLDLLNKSSNNAERNLILIVELMKAENFEAAKRVWRDFLVQENLLVENSNGSVDFWGSEFDLFVYPLQHVFKLEGEDMCEHQDTCKKPVGRYTLRMFKPKKDRDVQQQISETINSHFAEECDIEMPATTENRQNTKKTTIDVYDALTDQFAKRKVTACSGHRIISDMRFTSDDVWFYPLSLLQDQWSVQEAMELPKSIEVLGKTFYLRGFTVKEIKREHFVAYMWWNSKFYYYDAFRNGKMVPVSETSVTSNNEIAVANYAFYTV